jgi:sec-independent protein translocase protein TatA
VELLKIANMNLLVLLGMVGPWQIIVILAIVLLLFGGKKIPELMKGLGRGVREFKEGINPDEEEKDKEENKKA